MEMEVSLNPAEAKLISRAKKNRMPIYGSLELSPLCNMNCDMCYVRLSRQEMEAQGRVRTAKEWLALAAEMARAGVLYLQLTGGEPLIYPEFRELYLGLKKMGMILTINTNTTLIDAQWAAFFGRHKPRRINISLYGIDDAAYSDLCHYPGGFQKTVEGIRLLRANDVDVKLNVALTNSNKRDLERYDALRRELGVPMSTDTYLFPVTRERTRDFSQQSRPTPEEVADARIALMESELGKDTLRQYAVRLTAGIDTLPEDLRWSRWMDCMAGSCSFIVNWQGMLRPCIMMENPQIPVFTTGFAEGWRQIRAAAEKILLPEKCGACRLRELCSVCAASAMAEDRDRDGAPVFLCRTAEALMARLRRVAQNEKGNG